MGDKLEDFNSPLHPVLDKLELFRRGILEVPLDNAAYDLPAEEEIYGHEEEQHREDGADDEYHVALFA
jgi:hypothetical protein